MKLIGILLLAMLLYFMSMIDLRAEKIGTCVVGGYSIYPISNLDCKGRFYEP